MCSDDDNTPADADNTPRPADTSDTHTHDDTDTDTDTDDELDLDPAGAPCLVCGQTVPGPRPALICPDCTAVMDADTAPLPPRP
jgi:hypothetical protein